MYQKRDERNEIYAQLFNEMIGIFDSNSERDFGKLVEEKMKPTMARYQDQLRELQAVVQNYTGPQITNKLKGTISTYITKLNDLYNSNNLSVDAIENATEAFYRSAGLQRHLDDI